MVDLHHFTDDRTCTTPKILKKRKSNHKLDEGTNYQLVCLVATNTFGGFH